MSKPNPSPIPWRMFSIREAAKALSVHPATVRRWILSGQIRARRLGKLVRVPEDELALIAREGLGFPGRRKRRGGKPGGWADERRQTRVREKGLEAGERPKAGSEAENGRTVIC
jgi:excisionase family DNA binding protein